MRVEEHVRESIVGKKGGKSLLRMLSSLYQAGVWLRHQAYDLRLLSSKKVPAVVVSVGNIVAGGTGKTPLTHFLAQELSKQYSVAILSRGYRSRAEKRKEPVQVQQGMSAQEVGDEPLWLAQKLPHVQVWVGANRFASAQKAVAKGAEILILDDGFQHRRLYRDFDIVVLSEEPSSRDHHFLPQGYLRDLPSRLSQATLLAVMESPLSNQKIPQVVFDRTSPLSLQGKKVALFCAIANPERFLKQVQTLGGQIVASLFKPDHLPFKPEELQALAHSSRADLLVCTEKDFIKLPSLEISIPLAPVPLELKIKEGEEIWKKLIQQIQSQADHVRRVSSHTP